MCDGHIAVRDASAMERPAAFVTLTLNDRDERWSKHKALSWISFKGRGGASLRFLDGVSLPLDGFSLG